MHVMTTTHPRLRTLLALGVAALVTVGGIAPADAKPGPKAPKLLITGGDHWFTHDSGYPVVLGPSEVYLGGSDTPRVASLAANVHPSDYSLPGPGECESATAFLFVWDDGPTDLWLSSAGEVCGYAPQEPESVVTHVFTGPSTVEGSRPRYLVGREGFMEVRLGVDGSAHVFATAG